MGWIGFANWKYLLRELWTILLSSWNKIQLAEEGRCNTTNTKVALLSLLLTAGRVGRIQFDIIVSSLIIVIFITGSAWVQVIATPSREKWGSFSPAPRPSTNGRQLAKRTKRVDKVAHHRGTSLKIADLIWPRLSFLFPLWRFNLGNLE